MKEEEKKNNRIEQDSIGAMELPIEAYYGVHSLRAKQNFPITGSGMHELFITSLMEVKKAAAITNMESGELSSEIAEAVAVACDEVIAGRLREQFIVDAIQGGAGTSVNMNANEVLANRAIELLGGQKGSYHMVHPNDHVNMGQSTNDVIPTAGKLTVLKLARRFVDTLESLHEALYEKSVEFDDVLKMARTQLQDAVPMRLGQSFSAYAAAVNRTLLTMEKTLQKATRVNLGGTAVGTGINASPYYLEHVLERLSEFCRIPVIRSADLFDATEHMDFFVDFAHVLKSSAIMLSKLANDIRLLSSGPIGGFGEINIPARQNGSSIMPGKVNPVIPEVLNQAAFLVMGHDTTITLAAEAGQCELNAFEPVLFYCLFQSFDVLTNAVRTFTDHCVKGITANRERCMQIVERSSGLATILCPAVGYVKAAEIAKEAHRSGRTVRETALEMGVEETLLEELLNPMEMTYLPGRSVYDTKKNK